MNLNLSIKPWHLLAIALFVFLAILFHTSSSPYPNNQLKAHRWASKDCEDKGGVPVNCTIQIHQPGGEVAYFDICLEHGEWKRVK